MDRITGGQQRATGGTEYHLMGVTCEHDRYNKDHVQLILALDLLMFLLKVPVWLR
jgi:hypothetical protein